MVTEAKNRIIIGMFSSHIERVIEIVKVAEKCDKKVVIDGYSLKTSFEIIKALGYFHPKKDVIIPIEKIDIYHPSKVIAICTGSQGEQNASLMRIANKRHKHIKIRSEERRVGKERRSRWSP